MKKLTKILLIVAGSCIGAGLILGVIGFALGGKASISFKDGRIQFGENEPYYYNTGALTGIDKIDIDIINAEIKVVSTTDSDLRVEIDYPQSQSNIEVETEGNTIRVTEPSRFYLFNWNIDLFSLFNMGSNTVTVYVPKSAEYDSVQLETSNGKITCDADFNTDSIDLQSSNGAIFVNQITVNNKAYIKTSNGKIECDGTYNGSVDFKTSNGAIQCDGEYKSKVLVKTSNGKITMAGKYSDDVDCKTSNSSIEFSTTQSKTSHNLDAETSNGSVIVDGRNCGKEHYIDNNSSYTINLDSSNGGITVNYR